MADPLDDTEFMSVKGIAPFEVAYVFAHWLAAANDELRTAAAFYPDIVSDAALALCAGRGPPWPCGPESPEAFGRRMARGLYLYLKEV